MEQGDRSMVLTCRSPLGLLVLRGDKPMTLPIAILQAVCGLIGSALLWWKVGWWLPTAIFFLLFAEHIWINHEIKTRLGR